MEYHANNWKNIIYLFIAGFLIKLKFTPFVSKKNKLISINHINKNIQLFFDHFIIQNPQRNPDIIIELKKHIPLIINNISKKPSDNYLYLYQQRGKYVTTFQHISLNQFIFILIRIFHVLLKENNGWFLHCSASLIDGKAHLFLGKPGAGKSTIMTLLHPHFPALCDDSMIIKKEGRDYYCYQFPIVEKNWWVEKTNKRYEIGGIYILQKANKCSLEKISNKQKILSFFIQQLWTMPDDRNKQTAWCLDFIEKGNNYYKLYSEKNKKKILHLFGKFNKRS